ncbi:hypothetical protein AB0L40_25470, partial [Patulibacter sp. NPDC049589]|uniref:hypothetical protein n=1 Tax=Patulibacter sp. NPDC049589 TaxID=3154731 RepID=UPI00343E6771
EAAAAGISRFQALLGRSLFLIHPTERWIQAEERRERAAEVIDARDERVHDPAEAEDSSAIHPAPDRPGRDARPVQLAGRDDAVLECRDLGDELCNAAVSIHTGIVSQSA